MFHTTLLTAQPALAGDPHRTALESWQRADRGRRATRRPQLRARVGRRA